ncbi:hypothetical protein Sjap_020247 [Stephania japonica]|uniref:Nucleolar 27S pre-rRNA processing Urb2/Npa2 C-terminal domain-containing protein n=1 Tax=Stephania japonica TaxID=461633 RepID=A0AAP0F5K9_9MAGN
MADFEEDRKKKRRKTRSSEDAERASEAVVDLQTTNEEPTPIRDGPWRNLDLVLSLQNKQLDLRRKVEMAFDFVMSGGRVDCVETLSVSRLILFLNEWIQSLLISPDKKIWVERRKMWSSGLMEACLDFRCWEVFKFCLERSVALSVPLKFSSNILQAFSCIAVDALSILSSEGSHLVCEEFELYRILPDCVSILFSSHDMVLNANMDQWASLVGAVLVLVQKVYSVEVTGENSLHLLLHFSYLVLEPFANFLRAHPSPKNIFPLFVDKLLEQILRTLAGMCSEAEVGSSVWTRKISKAVEDILLNGLFHPAHVDGFLSTHSMEKYIETAKTDKFNSKAVIKSYHRHFFQKLENLITQGQGNISLLDGAGELFRLFIVRVKKQKGLHVFSGLTAMIEKTSVFRKPIDDYADPQLNESHEQSNSISKNTSLSSLGAETSKSLFDLFVQFMEPYLSNLKRYSQTDLDIGSILLNARVILKSINKILSVLMQEKIYSRSEDTSEGTCIKFLKEVYQTVISFSVRINLSWSYLKRDGQRLEEVVPLVAKEIVDALAHLVEIEYQVIGDDLVNLWLIVFAFSAIDTSLHGSPSSATLHFGSQLINIYNELRQVNNPIFALCKAVRLFGHCKKDSNTEDANLLPIRPSLSSEICIKSVAMLVCSQYFRRAISSAVKSIPEGQVSGCIQQVITDVSESLAWLKGHNTRENVEEFEGTLLKGCSYSDLSSQAELLGRALSEIYLLVLDNSVVSMGNSVLMGNTMKTLMMEICQSMRYLVGRREGSVSEFLVSVTGGRLTSDKLIRGQNGLLTTGFIASWIFLFFFRLYASCRSLYRQSIGLMPPALSKKSSAAMGDLLTASCGKDWMDRAERKDEGYFSWLIKPSHSFLTIVKHVSDACFQDTMDACAPLVYVLHVMALQRLVDLNRQIKAFEFLHEKAIQPVDVKSDNAASPTHHKERRKSEKRISVLRQEAVDVTDFLMERLSLITKRVHAFYNDDCAISECLDAQTAHEVDVWDMCVCSVKEKLLPTAIWWILCQNVDVWSTHASKKKLKKFLSCLFLSYSVYMNRFRDSESHQCNGFQNVTMHEVSFVLISDAVFYDQIKMASPIFHDSLCGGLDFNALDDLPLILRKLDDTSLVLRKRDLPCGKLSDTGQDYLLPSSTPMENALKLGALRHLLDLLCWMPKDYKNSKLISDCATYILNLERLVVLGLLEHKGEMKQQKQYELFQLFLCCRRAMKCLAFTYYEENVEVRQSTPFVILPKSLHLGLWLSKSLTGVLPLLHSFSGVHASQLKYLMFSLMDHTSYVFLTLGKSQLCTGDLLVHEDKLQLGSSFSCGVKKIVSHDLPTSLELADKDGDWKTWILMAETLKEQALSLLVNMKSDTSISKHGSFDSFLHVNKLSSVVSCFQGSMWGLVSVLSSIEKPCVHETKPLRERHACNGNLNLCLAAFEDSVHFFLCTLLLEDSFSVQDLHDKLILRKTDVFSFEADECPVQVFGSKTDISSDQENVVGRKVELVTNSEANGVTFSSTQKEKKSQSDFNDFDDNLMTKYESFEKYLKKSLLQDLLEGENLEVAFLVRQLFFASSAILKLKLHFRWSPLSSSSAAFSIGVSQYLLSQLAEMVMEPHSFSFVWLDGILKYIEVFGDYISSTNPSLSRNLYARLIDVHLRAIGRCIALQGKRAFLASHETESSIKTLSGETGSVKSTLVHGPYSLNEFKSRLQMSFEVMIRKAFELHFLTAVQSLERALAGVRDGCNVIYEIVTGVEDAGKISSMVASGVDCFDLLLESVSVQLDQMEARLDRIKDKAKKISAIQVLMEELKYEIGEANDSKQPDLPDLELSKGLLPVGMKSPNPPYPAPLPPLPRPSKSSSTMLSSTALYLFDSLFPSAISSTPLQFHTSKSFISVFLDPSLVDANAVDPALVLSDDMFAKLDALSLKSACHFAALDHHPWSPSRPSLQMDVSRASKAFTKIADPLGQGASSATSLPPYTPYPSWATLISALTWLLGSPWDPQSTFTPEAKWLDRFLPSTSVGATFVLKPYSVTHFAGRKRLNVLRRHIQSLAGALFNIVLHLQGPLIFYTKSFCCKSDVNPDNGAVVLMCVEVLTKVAGKSFFEIDSFLVGQALRLPAAIFQDFFKLRLSFLHNPSNSSKLCEEYSGASHVVNREFSVDLFAACCRLLSAVLRHHQSVSKRCISLLEDSLNIMIQCLEAVENESLYLKGYFAWDIQEGVKCASFLRRIYEEGPMIFGIKLIGVLLGIIGMHREETHFYTTKSEKLGA